MRIVIDTDAVRVDDGTAVLDDHLVLLAAAQAARRAAEAIEAQMPALPARIRSHADVLAHVLRSDALSSGRTLEDVAAFAQRLEEHVAHGTTRIAVGPDCDGGRSRVELVRDDTATACLRVARSLEPLRAAIELALDARRAVRLLERLGT
jgi:hypothetical protein